MTNVIELAKQAGDDWDSTRREDKEFLICFAKLVRNAALTEALNSYSPDDTAADYLEKIEDLKEPTPFTAKKLLLMNEQHIHALQQAKAPKEPTP